MKLIRFILSHAILLIFLIAIGVAYHYRAQLFPDKVTQKIDDTVHQALVFVKLAPKQEPQSQQQEAEQDTQSSTQIAEPAATTAEPQTAEPAAEETAQATETANEVTISESEAASDQQAIVQPEAQQPEQQQAMVEEKPVEAIETKQDEATQTKQDETTETTSVETGQTAQTAVVSSDKQAVATSHENLLNQARIAFHAGDSNKSVSIYQQLVDLNPDNPNTYGEMGNVLYVQGKWKEAGQAYYEAATRLLSSGQPAQVMYLYRVIQGLDPESAEKLRNQMGR